MSRPYSPPAWRVHRPSALVRRYERERLIERRLTLLRRLLFWLGWNR